MQPHGPLGSSPAAQQGGQGEEEQPPIEGSDELALAPGEDKAAQKSLGETTFIQITKRITG